MLDLKTADYVIAGCTLIGPILAVQAQRIIDRLRQKNDRRLTVFRTLMSTRASVVSPAHVEALNAVPIEFYGLRIIQDSWDKYYAHLNSDAKINPALWRQRSNDLLMALLSNIAKKMRYRFSDVALSNIYLPTGHILIEEDQTAIRKGLAAVLNGKQTLKMDVSSFPTDPEFMGGQAKVQAALIECLAGIRALKVNIVDDQR